VLFQKTWREIIECIKEVSYPTYQTINPPITKIELDNLEKIIGVTLPDSFKDYLFVMNGQFNNNVPLFGYNYFLSANGIIETWRMMNKLFDEEIIDWVSEDKIKPVIWDKGWIPFTDFEATTRLILDFSPGKNGSLGQVFLLHPGMDFQEVVADSFEEFTLGILDRLKQKAYSINSDVIEFDDLLI
jgi:cell wall assembly regulator SMI1